MVKPLAPFQIDHFLTGEIEYDFKCLSTILDALDALVYVSDIETHEIVFLNRFGRAEWGSSNQNKCFHLLQKDPLSTCEYCTNTKLTDKNNQPNGVHIWEFQNTVNEKWYQCRSQAIKWIDGRILKLEIAFDITEQKQLEHQLRTAHDEAKSTANTDPLLNCLNRRAFFERFEPMLAHCQRHQYPLTLVMMDIDNFKVFNDRSGHLFGDQILLTTTHVFEKSIRESDLFARYGGDEFILALPNTNQENAIELLSRIQKDMAKLAASPDSDFSITISFGLTSLTEKSNVDNLLNQADIALYQAKNAGRNRIEIYQAPNENSPQ
jgi:diguanylate cyclase (GGDEF)-like protein